MEKEKIQSVDFEKEKNAESSNVNENKNTKKKI